MAKNVPVPAADGESTLPLADLITKALEMVMMHALGYINGFNKLAGINQTDKDKVFWTLAVPALWDEMSKEMMKSCARRAGMIYFSFALEPIVSVFYVLNTQGKDFRLRAGDKLVVLDCGGGTIDAACVEIETSQWDLSELHHCDGIRAGGLDVDKKFIDMMQSLLPEDLVS